MKTEEFTYDIRRAEKSDIDRLVDLGTQFYGESNFHKGMTISKDNYRKTLEDYIGHPLVGAFVATVDGVIVGYSHVFAQTDYTVERVGELFQFFVQPEYRRTSIARSLAEVSVKQYHDWGCKRAYAEASPGMADPSHIKLFENLWGKFGYQKIGVTLMKEF